MEEKRERDNNFVTDLTLGLVDTLHNVAGVQDVSVVVRGGVERAGVVAWEQRNNVTLPQALKNFYFSTDGFKLTWNYATAGKVVGLGNLELLPLGRVNRLGSGRGSGDPLAPSLTDLALAEDSTAPVPSSAYISFPSNTLFAGPLPPTPSSSGSSGVYSSSSSSSSSAAYPPTFHTSKMFEVDSCQGYGKVVIAYPGRGEGFREGSYWFVDPSLRPHLLAEDTHTYWRLLLAHLGMPQWQALVAGLGLTPWARQWYEVVASYLVEGPRQPRLTPSYQDSPASRLDPTVFRARRSTHKARHGKENQGKDAKAKESSKEKAKEQAKDGSSKGHVKESVKESKEQTANVKEAVRDQSTVENTQPGTQDNDDGSEQRNQNRPKENNNNPAKDQELGNEEKNADMAKDDGEGQGKDEGKETMEINQSDLTKTNI